LARRRIRDMSIMELRIERPRRAKGEGHDPVLHTRAPAPLVELIQAKAVQRNVGVSVIIREALARYVASPDAREHAA
jgi:Ribbon-helix-helix protein, copG family